MSNSDPRALLVSSFDGLDQRLRVSVAEYLVSGKNPGLPDALSKDDINAIHSLGHQSRAEFYQALDRLDRADDHLLIRLARLLRVVHRFYFFNSELVPPSIASLLDDATRAIFGPAWFAPEFSTLSIDRLRALLAMEGVDPDLLDAALTDILIGSSRNSGTSPPRSLQTIPGIAQFATEHAAVVVERAASFTPQGHIELARLASEHPPLARAIVGHLAAEAAETTAVRRNAALAAIADVPADIQAAAFSALLDRLGAPARLRLVPAIERISDPQVARSLLEAELARAKSPALVAELGRAIERLGAFAESVTGDDEGDDDFEILVDSPLDAAAVDYVTAEIEAHADSYRRRLPGLRTGREKDLQQQGYAGSNELEMVSGMVERAEQALRDIPAIVPYVAGDAPDPLSDSTQLFRLARALPAANRIRVAAASMDNWAGHISLGSFDEIADARTILEFLERIGVVSEEAHRAIVSSYLVYQWDWRAPTLAPKQLVGYARDYPHVFEVVLGLTVGELPVSSGDYVGQALAVLEASPRMDARYLPIVTAIATGSTKAHRREAQAVLERHGLGWQIASQALVAGSPEQRTAAVRWVASIGGEEAVSALGAVVRTDKTPAVRAIAIASLESLGENTGDYLRPEYLEKEATAGLARRRPAGLDWFPFDDLQPARYADGTSVPREVLEWWVRLAASLRDPLGAGLIPRYLQTLAPADQIAVSRLVLLAWIARDVTPLDDAMVMDSAMQSVAGAERKLRALDPELAEMEWVISGWFDQLDSTRAALADTVPSANGEKGILALAGSVPGPELAETVRQYMRRNHLKRAQIEALLKVLSLSPEREPLQLLVATARRYRTAKLQQSAVALVESVAEQRGWTPDELADRMIPAAGLDANGRLRLDIGERSFTAALTPTLALQLETADGSPIKALPAARVDESDSAAKAALATARRELKAVLSVQRRRLYDAMCLRRAWTIDLWTEQLLHHPIVGALVGGLVWQVDGIAARIDGGQLVNLAGDPIATASDAVISVAHSTTIDSEDVESWREWANATLLGFDQFRAARIDSGAAAALAAAQEGTEISTFVLRRLTQRAEWDRGSTGDGARFDEYVKSFPSAGIQAVLSFSGSSLPETEEPVELGVLSVRTLDRGSFTDVALETVPEALLAELLADYANFGG